MKKNTLIITIILLLLVNVSCSNWLDVSPRTERPEDEMFDSENGFKDALTGVYLEMIDNQAYGEFLTMSKIENLVNFWTVAAGSAEEALSQHDYTNASAETVIQNMYGRLYKIILAANAILEHIDGKKTLFATGHYEAVKGECLAIRAMCHFDLLRLFGPVPSQVTDASVLSYVTTVGPELNPLLSVAEYKELLYDDLNEAESLLQEHWNFQVSIEDEYFKYTSIRMNLWSLKGLKARVALWFGEYGDAYESAMEVINATDDTGEKLFTLGSAETFANNYFVLPCEHVFALYRFDMDAKYSSLFGGGTLYKGESENTIKNDLFNNSGSDIRELNLWEQIELSNGAPRYVLKKYKTRDKVTSAEQDIQNIPLIRLSEMYLIAVEAGQRTDVEGLWEEFRMSRNLNLVDLPDSREERMEVLVPEYQKEFYAEGQVFYLYKRLNLSKDNGLWLWSGSTPVNYVLPLPKTEVITN